MSSPALILVSGKPGSGKSTLARILAKEFKTVLIDKDYIDEAFSPGDRGPTYLKFFQPGIYQILLNLAELNLNLGNHVILDASWTHNLLNDPALVERIQGLVKLTKAKLIILEMELSAEAIRQRLLNRSHARDKNYLTEEGWEGFLKRHRFGEKNPLPHHSIDGTKSLDAYTSEAIEYIKIGLSEK